MPIYLDEIDGLTPTTELGNNKRVKIDLRPSTFTILATDGSILRTAFNFIFYTHATPVYTDVDHIQIQGGDLFEDLAPALLYLHAYASSTRIDDMMLFDPSAQFTDETTQAFMFFRRARMEFVTCKATADLIRAIITSKGTRSGRRTLADFTIDLSSQANLLAQSRGYLGDLLEACNYWQEAVFSMGQADFELVEAESGQKSLNSTALATDTGRGWVVGGPTLNSRERGPRGKRVWGNLLGSRDSW